MLKHEIECLEKETIELYFNNLEKRLNDLLDDFQTSAVQTALSDRENVFISKYFFNSRKYYFKALLNNSGTVNIYPLLNNQNKYSSYNQEIINFINLKIFDKISQGKLLVKNRYFTNNQQYQFKKENKINSNERESVINNSKFLKKIENKSNQNNKEQIDVNDLKINLDDTYTGKDSISKKSHIAFKSILLEKKQLDEQKEKRKLQLSKKRILDDQKLKEMEIEKMEIERNQRKIKAEKNLKKIVENQKRREEKIKASKNYKYIKDIVPLFKVWENKFKQDASMTQKFIRNKKNINPNEIMMHSKKFKNLKIKNQKIREEKIKKEMVKNRSISHIIQKFKNEKRSLLDKSAEIKKRKDKQRKFSLQVNILIIKGS